MKHIEDFKNFITEKYGDKRDYRKIDIFIKGKYVASTTWAKTLKQAKDKFIEKHNDVSPTDVITEFSDKT